ncbi:MAG: hypothetical protein AAF798_22510 [Bacteroidota bacterium]
MPIYWLMLTFCLFCTTLCCQKAIPIKNPSFEANRAALDQTPYKWSNCSIGIDSPPDILTVNMPGTRNFNYPAAAGENHLALLHFEDGSMERIGQRLAVPLQAGAIYRFSLFARQAYAGGYTAKRTSYEALQYLQHPLALEVWGGFSSCDDYELLASSMVIENRHWQRVDFVFRPSANFTHLMISPQCDQDPLQGGHIMIDDLSTIIPIGNSPNDRQLFQSPPFQQFRKWVKPTQFSEKNLPILAQKIEQVRQLYPHERYPFFGLGPKVFTTLFDNLHFAPLLHSKQDIRLTLIQLPTKDRAALIQNLWDLQAFEWATFLTRAHRVIEARRQRQPIDADDQDWFDSLGQKVKDFTPLEEIRTQYLRAYWSVLLVEAKGL